METIEINEANLLKAGFTKKLNMYKYDGWWLSLNKGSEWLLSKGDLEIKVDTLDKVGTMMGVVDICYPIRNADKPKTIFTYLAFDGRLYKIGKSKNPKNRLKQLQTGNANCRMICYGTGVSEAYLHNYFKERRVKNEWFALSPKESNYAKKLIKAGMDITHFDKERPKKKQFNPSTYVIDFGKHKGKSITDMTSDTELQYCNWYISTAENTSDKRFKAFQWWCKENLYKNLK